MPGPKYVNDFTFPKSFGFSGSSGEVSVRPHTRQRFAKGGRVRKPPPRDSVATLKKLAAAAGAGAAGAYAFSGDDEKPRERLSVGETARGEVRERREKELGLKKGGKVKRMRNC